MVKKIIFNRTLLQKKGNWVEDKEDTVIFPSQRKILMFVLCFNIEIWREKGKFSIFKSIILFFCLALALG